MRILVINSGSSSLKYRFLASNGEVIAKGLIERVGTDVPNHRAALEAALRDIDVPTVDAVGHRVVHGGERFRDATPITPDVIATLEELTPLAPLHNPPGLEGIRASLDLLKGKPNVAVFDTAFHATLPPEAYLYALPYDLYREHGVRRYGFHGTSHAFVAREAARIVERPLETLKIVTLHLGNGASATAVKGGVSVDTSMGFTPLEGLVMGTRSGDIDPAIGLWLAERFGAAQANDILNRRSGVLGVSGVSNDLRDVHRARIDGDERALLALQVMVHRLRQYVGAYAAVLGGLDVLAFTGGVGENDAWVRAEVLRGLEFLGLRLDSNANERGAARITLGDLPAALVVPTDEEGEIARQTAAVLSRR
ncbi:acetate/propionate family kinase [Deinococcus yavapaiensis]|uniref:Acetate kinase n=1 Tax=Deinococcus yavapaiensis KR-236 TaxID=694435 RepID=A0A318S3D2_9DEIO|nr:acetate kinase [Deinococcus yavapaiensis]PYE53028.1 acetate kinase [Deinococcus yavapaiensis KR-236]